MTKDEILIELAKLKVLSKQLWECGNKYQSFGTNYHRYRAMVLEEKEDKLILQYLKVSDDAYVVQFRGGLTDAAPDELSHYDIDDALAAKFGDSVLTDSESGGFFVDSTIDIAGKVATFLRDHYPALDFIVCVIPEARYIDDDAKPPNGGRYEFLLQWLKLMDFDHEVLESIAGHSTLQSVMIPGLGPGDAEKLLKEHKIPFPELVYQPPLKPAHEIVEALEEAEQILLRTGLSKKEALHKLKAHMNI